MIKIYVDKREIQKKRRKLKAWEFIIGEKKYELHTGKERKEGK